MTHCPSVTPFALVPGPLDVRTRNAVSTPAQGMPFAGRARMRVSICLAALLLVMAPTVSHAQRQAVRAPQGPAWDALRAGDHDTAAREFGRAVRNDPTNPLNYFGLGVAQHGLGLEDQAQRALRKALELEPRFAAAALVLGQIQYAEGDLDGAIATYTRAMKTSGPQPEMQKLLDQWKREADVHGSMETGAGGRFALQFDGPEERALADRVSRVLESAYWDIGRRLNAYPSRTIPVILYTDQHFADITRSPTWAAGIYDGRIRLAVGDALKSPGALDRVVIHEFAHAVVHDLAPRGVPAWLHEGLAVNFEPGDQRWVNQVLADQELVPLAELEAGFTGLSSSQAVLAYAESAAAARVIMDRIGPNLPSFLASLGSAANVDAALATFGFTIADVERAIKRRSQ
jgi:Tfp pilus assembly protein PilF